MIVTFTHPGRKDSKKTSSEHIPPLTWDWVESVLNITNSSNLWEETFPYLILPGTNVSKKKSKIADIEGKEHFG